MKFAHIADAHIGSWRDPRLSHISTEAFKRAIDISLKENVDFILIAGDLFNTPLPSIDALKATVEKLKEVKDKNTPVYFIAGSHDYSPSGKTMLDVIENAGLAKNVSKGEVVDGKLKLNFVKDEKTQTLITGLLGKRQGLEKHYYENLHHEHLENQQGYKIFMFHTGIDELKSKEMEKIITTPISLLPKNFNYYAGGHVHEVSVNNVQNYGTMVYPGPLFPNSFKELEELQRGGFYIVENNMPTFHPIQVYNTHSIKLDATHKSPQQVEEEILEHINNQHFINTIVTLRVEGTLRSGTPSQINFKKLFDTMYKKNGAYFVMKNTTKLTSKEYQEIKVDTRSTKDVEQKIITEHLGQIKVEDITNEENLIKDLLIQLDDTKEEGERVIDFETRLKEKTNTLLNLNQ